MLHRFIFRNKLGLNSWVCTCQALTLRIFPACPRKSPLNNKLVPEKNLLVLIKQSCNYSLPIFLVFHSCH